MRPERRFKLGVDGGFRLMVPGHPICDLLLDPGDTLLQLRQTQQYLVQENLSIDLVRRRRNLNGA
jgi:hypothetical protein